MNPWNRGTAEVQSQSTAAVDAGLRSYMLKVYNLMTCGVLLTAVIAYFAGTSPALQQMLVVQGAEGVSLSPIAYILAFAPAAMGFLVLPRMPRMSTQNMQLTFWSYAIVMGLSLFTIFWAYTEASVLRVLLITAGTFGLLSIYGYTTKRDLSGMRAFLFVGVIALFLTSVVNMFLLKSTGLDLALSYVGVLIAIGLTVYYTQETKAIYYQAASGGQEMVKRASIMGALNLYFSFIMLFIYLLRILGERR